VFDTSRERDDANLKEVMVGSENDFDLAVLGAGPGGYVGAIRAAQLGLKVAVIEEARPGGVCLNWGCIPTKALLHGAELAEALRTQGEMFGIRASGVTYDYAKAIEHSRKVSDRLCKGVESLLGKNKIELIHGRGCLTSANMIAVSGGERLIQAQNILLATGSGEWIPSGVEIDGERVLTSREALVSKTIPERLVVVGAGAVGLEFAYLYASYGARVTVIEMAEQVLPGADAEVADVIAREFRRKRIELRTKTRFEALELSGKAVVVHAVHEDESVSLPADQVLIAIGRKPLSQEIGLEEAGVALTGKGFVAVDEQLRTSVPQIRAIGDLVGPPLLAHKASEEGIAAVEFIAGLVRAPLDHRRIPGCIYTQPQVAWVGLTEAKARAQYSDDLRVGKFPFLASGKAVATAHTAGFVKILAEPEYGEVVGAHIVGAGATELIAEVCLGMNLEMTTEEISGTCHAHPTLSEAILEAALAAEGRGIHY